MDNAYEIDEPCCMCGATPVDAYAAKQELECAGLDKPVSVVVIEHKCRNPACGFIYTEWP